MDPTSLAAGLIAAKTGQMQMAMAAKMMKMNAEASKSVVQMLEAGQANLEKLNNLATGVGGNLDVTA
jgi:diphthamide synthase subunit DPH2